MTPSEFCLHCSPYIASASSSFSRSARACPDSAERLTLVLQHHQHRKACVSSTCNMVKPASVCCPCPAEADASRRQGRRRLAHETHPKCPQTPRVHSPPVPDGHASPLLLQTSCKALLSSGTLLLPGRLHLGCQLLLTGPCRHSPATVHTAVPWAASSCSLGPAGIHQQWCTQQSPALGWLLATLAATSCTQLPALVPRLGASSLQAEHVRC